MGFQKIWKESRDRPLPFFGLCFPIREMGGAGGMQANAGDRDTPRQVWGGQGWWVGAEIRKFLDRCTGNVSLKKDRQTHVHLMSPKAPISHRAWAPPQAPFTLTMGGGLCFPVCLCHQMRGAGKFHVAVHLSPWHVLSAQAGQTDL